uniref:Uncharacterized protein n=1 Tax=Meleagris gallopavo TaxID=9103 RepID=A0A803XL59_MELGA
MAAAGAAAGSGNADFSDLREIKKQLLSVAERSRERGLQHSHYEVTLQPSPLQAAKPQLSQPVLAEEVLRPSDHHHSPPLDNSMSSLCWGLQHRTQCSR